MSLLGYTHAITLPFIFFFSIPLAIFASITSIFAFTILLIRVLIIYAELAVAVVPFYLLGLTTRTSSTSGITSIVTTTGLLPNSNVPRRRKRRTSTGSFVSTGSLTPVPSAIGLNLGLPLNQSIGSQRDFEGVGGWRLDAPSEDDNLWTNMNSRLELPADHVRRHKRSLTSGSLPGERAFEGKRLGRSYSPEAVMMTTQTSPNTSRARTPPTVTGTEGYFPPQGGGPKAAKKSSGSVATNNSGSLGSSKASSGVSLKIRS